MVLANVTLKALAAIWLALLWQQVV